jgi:TonB-dependent starch-binding outer membrane protein SusC
MKKSVPIFNYALLIMKITLLPMALSVVCSGLVIASPKESFGQTILDSTVSINAANRKLRVVLVEIEHSAKIKFSFNPKSIPIDQKVSVGFQNTRLKDILDKLLGPLDIVYEVSGNYIILSKSLANAEASAAPQLAMAVDALTISGTVSDENNQPLPGVNVIVKGTTSGTTTDAKGNYALEVPSENSILVFSFIGYAPQEIFVSSRTIINVALALDVKQLEEVVVIGYGEVKKGDLTGAVGTVSETDMKSVIKTSFDQALQGRVAGVLVTNNSGQPGGGISVRIRGTSSINSSNEPLYVVDGVPIDGNAEGIATGFNWAGGGNGQTGVSRLSSINPDDIISINVLKDASAQAIYGSRAANGVVIVTTKRGKAGESKITYSSYVGVQKLGKIINVMELPEYAEYFNEGFDLVGISTKPPQFADPSLLGRGTSWQNEIYQSASMQNHNIGFTGGNEKSTYAISTGYFDQNGIVLGTDFHRYSMRVNLDSKIKDWLKIGNSLSLSHTSQRITLTDQDDGVVNVALTQAPSVPVKNIDGSWAGPVAANQNSTFDNPVAKSFDRNLNVKRYQVLGNIFAELSFLKNFMFRSELGVDMQLTNNYTFIPTYNYGPFNINKVNRSRRDRTESIYWVWKNYLTYNKTYNKTAAHWHAITATAGHEAQSSTWEYLSATRNKFQSNAVQEINAGDGSTSQNSGTKGDWAMESYFVRLLYNYTNRYLLTGTFRADASSNFSPRYKWAYFPSMSLRWNISNESFFPKVQPLDNLALRIGYGETGNQAIPPFQYSTAIGTSLNGLGSVSFADKISNPNVRWETAKQLNAGMEVGLLKSRVQLTADFYIKTTQDALMQQSLPDYFASRGNGNISAPWVNLGKIENRGIELTLSTNILEKPFTWSTTITFTRNLNKVISMGSGVTPIDGVAQYTNVITRTTEGQPVGMFYGYVADGIFLTAEELRAAPAQSKGSKISRTAGTWIGDYRFRNINGDSVVDAADKQFIGNPQPDFSYGINNTLKYKNIDLSIYLQGTYGNKIFNLLRSRAESMIFLGDNQTIGIRDRAKLEMISATGSPDDPSNWRVTNPGTKVPRHIPGDPNDNARMSDRYIEDGSYLRIQNITLGYTLLKGKLSKYINNLRIYASVQNLHTFTKYSGYDPEVGSYNQDQKLTGVDNGRYPMPRTITVGINVEF